MLLLKEGILTEHLGPYLGYERECIHCGMHVWNHSFALRCNSESKPYVYQYRKDIWFDPGKYAKDNSGYSGYSGYSGSSSGYTGITTGRLMSSRGILKQNLGGNP